MNYFEYMASYIKGGGSGDSPSGGTKTLTYRVTGDFPVADIFPAGSLDEKYGFIRIWDTAPTMEELDGGVFGLVELYPAKALRGVFFQETSDGDFKAYGVPVSDGDGGMYLALLVVLNDASMEGMSIPKGIYVSEKFISSNYTTFLIYGIE